MLSTLLELKQAYWGLNSEEYIEWKEYFISLSEAELIEEYSSHFPEVIQ